MAPCIGHIPEAAGWTRDDYILELDDLPPHLQAIADQVGTEALHAVVVALASLPPHHTLVIAARIALEDGQARWDDKVARRQIGKDMAAGTDWRRIAANHIEHTELQRRRAVPGPLAARSA